MTKRRQHKAAFKARVALEALKNEQTVTPLGHSAQENGGPGPIVGSRVHFDGQDVS